MHKVIELVNHENDKFSVTSTSDRFYEELEPELPEHLKQTWDTCHIGDYTIFKPEFNLLEFCNWCNEKGISVLVSSRIYNNKYWVE